MSEKKKSKIGCWIAITILVLLLFGSCLINIGLTAALFTGSEAVDTDYPLDEYPSYQEIWSYGNGDVKAVRIELEGVIIRGPRERLIGYKPDMVESVLSQIQAATMDEDVQAIILEVNSPGGAVTASDEIHAALTQFKRANERRVIMVFIRDLGASGAYYAAMAADYIMAEPTAIVGSVGVMMQTLNMKELSNKIGLHAVTITSGKNKAMFNPFEEVNPEHVAMLQELVDSMYDRFATLVKEARGLSRSELLDGRVFNVQQALKYNLIDEVGYWKDAIDRVEEMMGVEALYVIRYRMRRGFFDNLLGVELPEIPNFRMIESPRFMYLWNP